MQENRNIIKPLISIIIPCYNDAQYIEQSVNSALNQTYGNIEVIVVDDGSNEETKAVLKRLEPKITKLITQENQGVCVARNIAIEFATGKYILTLDSDDFFEPSFLSKAVDVIEESEDIGMVTCWMQLIDENNEKMYIQKPSGASVNETLYYNNSVGSCLFRKSVWAEIGGYDSHMKNGFEDWEFNISLTKSGRKVFVIQEVLFNYRYKLISRNSDAYKYQNEIRRYVFNKHKDVAINNYNKTIDFFLNEIEINKKLSDNCKNSKSFKIGQLIVRFIKRSKSIFKIKNK